MSSSFFYDAQIKRYLVQFSRIFSDFKHEIGPDSNGITSQARVPIVYGDPSWQAATIITGGSQNALAPIPLMAYWITNLALAPERRADPTNESRVTGTERLVESGAYTSEQGNSFMIDRYMPVPYTLGMQLDIWTSNTNTKLQLIEQILTIFNPSLQLTQNSNKFDWTSIFEVELANINWTNRNIPQGTDSDYDIASLNFDLQIWINPPAKLKKQSIIEQIVVRINEASILSESIVDTEIEDPLSCIGQQISQTIVTPGDFKISIGVEEGFSNNQVVLLNSYGVYDETISWVDLFATYGRIVDDVARLRLHLTEDIEEFDTNVLIGNISVNEDFPNVLDITYDTDTIPGSTVGNVIKIIDPSTVWPGNGLLDASVNHRYLLLGNYTAGEEGAIPNDTRTSWGNLNANENDIIEFNGTEWVVSFDSDTSTNTEYVYNATTDNYYKFEDGSWSYTFLGVYAQGYWRLENLTTDLESPGLDCG